MNDNNNIVNNQEQPVQPIQEQAPKEKTIRKDVLIFLVVLLVFGITIGIGLGINMAKNNNDKEVKKETPPLEEPKKDPNAEENDQAYRNINGYAKQLHAKYHKISADVEHTVYVDKKTYNLTDSKVIAYSFSKELYNRVESSIKDLIEKDDDGKEYITIEKGKPIIKEAFNDFFGHIVEYSDEYFSGENVEGDTCNYFHLDKDNDRYYIIPNCEHNEYEEEYSINRVEVEGKHVYVYETIKVIDPETKEVKEKLGSKWTYVKVTDKNDYFFVKAEPASNNKKTKEE